jgi:hypothetical protein
MSEADIRGLGFVSTPRGWVPVDAAEEHQRTGLTARQSRRFAFVNVRGWTALPEGFVKPFALGASLGKIMNVDKTFRAIKNAHEALCVVVFPVQRDRILDLLDHSDTDTLRPWRRAAKAWQAVGLAHDGCAGDPNGVRFKRQCIALFFEPVEVCPVCETAMPRQSDPPSDGSRPAMSRRETVPELGAASRDGKGAVQAVPSSPVQDGSSKLGDSISTMRW